MRIEPLPITVGSKRAKGLEMVWSQEKKMIVCGESYL